MERKEAIEVIRSFLNSHHSDIFSEALETLIPELAESEDEKIAKELIRYLPYCDDIAKDTKEKWIAWLEKQGEAKSTEKIEPKFKVGDWIFYSADNCGGVRHITKIDEKGYYIERNGYPHGIIPFKHEIYMKLWTIDDAKDGDVLAFYCEYKGKKIEQVGIIKKYVGKESGCSDSFNIYVGVNWDNYLKIGLYMGSTDIQPATNEQREFLFSRMKELGYKWDSKKKELKKIKHSK